MILGEVDPGLKTQLLMVFMVVGVILLRGCISDAEVMTVLQWHREVPFLSVFEDVRGRREGERLRFMGP